jgi:hypothetical protein
LLLAEVFNTHIVAVRVLSKEKSAVFPPENRLETVSPAVAGNQEIG